MVNCTFFRRSLVAEYPFQIRSIVPFVSSVSFISQSIGCQFTFYPIFFKNSICQVNIKTNILTIFCSNPIGTNVLSKPIVMLFFCWYFDQLSTLGLLTLLQAVRSKKNQTTEHKNITFYLHIFLLLRLHFENRICNIFCKLQIMGHHNLRHS